MDNDYLTDLEMAEIENHFGATKPQKSNKIDWWLVVETAMVVFTIGLAIIVQLM